MKNNLMANINDYKIIDKKSLKYFNLLESALNRKIKLDADLLKKERERFGFYLFVLEHLTEVKDILSLMDMITDSDFNCKVFGSAFDDLGIDAIYINEDQSTIQLFNFKFRNNFSTNSSKINNAILSTKFINVIDTSKTDGLKDKIKEIADSIILKLTTKDEWKLQLYIVSNENFIIEENEDIKRLKEVFGLEIFNFCLNEVSQFISLVPA